MDVYELSVDLAPGVRDLEFAAALNRYLTALQADGRIEHWRLLRSKLGLGARSEFKVIIETRDLAQLDAAFAVVSTRADPLEEFHPFPVSHAWKKYPAVSDIDAMFELPHFNVGENRTSLTKHELGLRSTRDLSTATPHGT